MSETPIHDQLAYEKNLEEINRIIDQAIVALHESGISVHRIADGMCVSVQQVEDVLRRHA